MKKLIFLGLVTLTLLTTPLIPQPLLADTEEQKTPESWLTEEETAYAAQMRSAYAAVRAAIPGLRVRLRDPEVAGSTPSSANAAVMVQWAWHTSQVYIACLPFCNAKSPESMQNLDDVHAKLCAYANACNYYGNSLARQRLGAGSPILSAPDIWSFMLSLRDLNNLNTTLNSIEDTVNEAEGKLNAIVTRLGKERGEESKPYPVEVKRDEDVKPTPVVELSKLNTGSYYVVIDAAKFSDNDTITTWNIRGTVTGNFFGNTFSGTAEETNDKGCVTTRFIKATFDDNLVELKELYIEQETHCPARGGIQAKNIKSIVSSHNITRSQTVKDKIYCRTASPNSREHMTQIEYSSVYGTSNPNKLVTWSCKQQCWIELTIEAK